MKYVFRVLVFPVVAAVFLMNRFFDGIEDAIHWYEVRLFRKEWERIHSDPCQGRPSIFDDVKWPRPTGFVEVRKDHFDSLKTVKEWPNE